MGKFIRYIIIGGSTFLLDIGLLYGLTEILGLYYLFSATSAWIIATAVNYLLNKFWSFKSSSPHFYSSIKYAFLLGWNYFVMIAAMYIFVDRFGFYYIYVKIFIMTVIVCWNFFIYKNYVYKD